MAEIRVNQEQWSALSEADREKITNGLRETGAIGGDDRIVGDPSAPAFDEETQMMPMWNPIKDICKAACDVTATAAAAWCTANTSGVGLAACLAAAEAGREICRGRC